MVAVIVDGVRATVSHPATTGVMREPPITNHLARNQRPSTARLSVISGTHTMKATVQRAGSGRALHQLYHRRAPGPTAPPRRRPALDEVHSAPGPGTRATSPTRLPCSTVLSPPFVRLMALAAALYHDPTKHRRCVRGVGRQDHVQARGGCARWPDSASCCRG